MRLFRHPWWQHLDYRVKVATTQENKPPTQGTRQWTFTTPRWRCGSILLPSLNAEVPESAGGGQGQRSKVKVTEVNSQLSRSRTATPVWIQISWWNDAQSLMLLRRIALLFFKSSVKFQGHIALKIVEFDPDWAFPDCNSSLNSPMATKWCTNLEAALKRCPIIFQYHMWNFKVTRL